MFYKTYIYLNTFFRISFEDVGLENRFQKDFLKNNIKQNIIAMKIVILAYLIYYFVAYLSTPQDFTFNAFYVLPIPIIASIISLYILSRLRNFGNIPLIFFIYGVIIALPPLINILHTDQYYTIYLRNFALPIFAIFVMFGMPFIVASLAAAVILLFFFIAIFVSPVEAAVIYQSIFYIFITSFIAVISGFLMEKSQRKSYLAMSEQEELNKRILYEQAVNEKQYKQIMGQKQELEDQKELYELVFKNTSSGVLIIDIEANKFIDCNEQAIEMLESDSKDDVLDLHPAQLSPEYQPDGMLSSEKADIMIALAVKNNNHTFEWLHLTKTNKDIWIEVTLTPIALKGEKVLHVLWKDISDRKKAEEELSQQYDLINNIINTVPIRIFWKDKDSYYRGANKLLLKDAQLDSLDDILGKTDFDMPWGKTEAQSYRDDDLEVINSGKVKINYEETQTDDDGNSITLLASKVPLRGANGDVIGVLGTYSDITSLRNMENELEKQRQQLIAQSRLAQMGEMISMIAHQWRQPLAAISTSAINLKLKLELEDFDFYTKAGVDESSEYILKRLENIDGFVHNLTTTIDDFRNFYKPNKDSVLISFEEVISKALNIIQASLDNDNIELVYNYNSKKKLEMYTSEMMQVLLNVLQNAQDNFKEKEIENPQIILSIDEKSLTVCDNGGGIQEDIIEKIFDPYFSTKDEKNGTGLGLYMSKTIVEEHHKGKLTVRNKNGGVCFMIELNR